MHFINLFKNCVYLYYIAPSAADYIPYCCPGLEVSAGPCSGLSLRSLLSHPGHQRSQILPLNGRKGYSLSFLSCTSTSQALHSRWLAPLYGMGFHWHRIPPQGSSLTFYSSLKTVFFSRARVRSAFE